MFQNLHPLPRVLTSLLLFVVSSGKRVVCQYNVKDDKLICFETLLVTSSCST